MIAIYLLTDLKFSEKWCSAICKSIFLGVRDARNGLIGNIAIPCAAAYPKMMSVVDSQ